MLRVRVGVGLLVLAVLVVPRQGKTDPLPPPEGCMLPVEGSCPASEVLTPDELILQYLGPCEPVAVGANFIDDGEQCCYAIEAACGSATLVDPDEKRGCGK